MSRFLDLPPDLKATDPQFIAILNDRLRRLDGARSSSSTLVGGGGATQIILTVPGTLGISTDAAPTVTLPAARSAVQIVAYVKQAPTGAGLSLEMHVGPATATPWAALTIAAAATSGSVGGPLTIAADAKIRLDIVGVGSTFPGADLTVIIRLA